MRVVCCIYLLSDVGSDVEDLQTLGIKLIKTLNHKHAKFTLYASIQSLNGFKSQHIIVKSCKDWLSPHSILQVRQLKDFSARCRHCRCHEIEYLPEIEYSQKLSIP